MLVDFAVQIRGDIETSVDIRLIQETSFANVFHEVSGGLS